MKEIIAVLAGIATGFAIGWLISRNFIVISIPRGAGGVKLEDRLRELVR